MVDDTLITRPTISKVGTLGETETTRQSIHESGSTGSRMSRATGSAQTVNRESLNRSTSTPPGKDKLENVSRLFARLPGNELVAAAVSCLCLILTLAVTSGLTDLVLEMAAALLMVRIAVVLVRRSWSTTVLTMRRQYIRQVWSDEILFGLSLPAAAFLFQWPIAPAAAATFFAVNITAQFGLFFVSRLTLRTHFGLGLTSAQQCAVIVGTGKAGRRVADALLDHPELDTRPIAFLDFHRDDLWRYRDIPLLGNPNLLEGMVMEGQVDALILAVDMQDILKATRLIETAERLGVSICVMPELFQTQIAVAEVAHMNGFPTLLLRTVHHGRFSVNIKQIIDLLGGLALTLIALPIMLLTAIAIKIDSRGPVLFKQVRSGRNGRKFMLLKFRTMTCDAETKKDGLLSKNEMSGPVFKIKNDPRITRVGHYLRKYSIDELPQLFNILLGDMSLVGPRPPLPSEVIKFEPWQRRKLSVKPGLTCLWQVNGRNAIDFTDWMRLDLEYIDHWSLWLDAKILAKTIPTVIRGSGS